MSNSQILNSGLSPHQRVLPERTNSLSRPSSRSSNRSARAQSPSKAPYSLDDPGQSFIQVSLSLLLQKVAVRNQISTLKHTIRHQQAQVHDLENIILRGPRPYSDLPPDLDPLMALSSPPSSYNPSPKMSKRSSFEVLHGIAGPDSNLPLPRRGEMNGSEDGIREGIPMNFGATSPTHHKRISSPTRTLSRMFHLLSINYAHTIQVSQWQQ